MAIEKFIEVRYLALGKFQRENVAVSEIVKELASIAGFPIIFDADDHVVIVDVSYYSMAAALESLADSVDARVFFDYEKEEILIRAR